MYIKFFFNLYIIKKIKKKYTKKKYIKKYFKIKIKFYNYNIAQIPEKRAYNYKKGI